MHPPLQPPKIVLLVVDAVSEIAVVPKHQALQLGVIHARPLLIDPPQHIDCQWVPNGYRRNLEKIEGLRLEVRQV